MIVNGFALERISTGEEIEWWGTIPSRVFIPGEKITVDAAAAGWSFGDYRIVNKEKTFPDPEPVRRMVDKSTIIERLTDEELDAALALMTTRQKERWRMPGHPSVYADDKEVIGLLNAIGVDPDKILA